MPWRSVPTLVIAKMVPVDSLVSFCDCFVMLIVVVVAKFLFQLDVDVLDVLLLVTKRPTIVVWSNLQ